MPGIPQKILKFCATGGFLAYDMLPHARYAFEVVGLYDTDSLQVLVLIADTTEQRMREPKRSDEQYGERCANQAR